MEPSSAGIRFLAIVVDPVAAATHHLAFRVEQVGQPYVGCLFIHRVSPVGWLRSTHFMMRLASGGTCRCVVLREVRRDLARQARR